MKAPLELKFTLFWISSMFSCSAALLAFHLGQEFSACGIDVFRTQRMCWEKMFTATVGISEVWWVQAALGAPLDPGTSQLVLLQCIVAYTPGEVQHDSSRILMLPAPGNGRGWVSRNLGSSSHYFQSGFNNSAMHCSNTCQALNFGISDLLFATVLTWSSLNCFITAYLPRTDLTPGFPCGFSQRVHGNRPLKIHVKGLWGGQPRWCVLVAKNKCAVFSIQELWNLIQMNKKWKNETTQRKPLYQDVC